MTRFVLNLTKVKEIAFASDYLSVQSDLSTLISCEERGREFIRHQENNYGIEVTDRDLKTSSESFHQEEAPFVER